MITLTLDTLQWVGCVTGAAGSLLLALNTKHSGLGFVLFLVSNGFWVMYGIETHAPGLITNQIFFTATSLIGIYRWLVVSPRTETNVKIVTYKLDKPVVELLRSNN